MSSYSDDFYAVKAQERFVDVALHVISEGRGRENLELTLIDEYNDHRILTNETRHLLDDAVNRCMGAKVELARRSKIATDAKISDRALKGPPSREKVRALDEYSNSMEWLYSALSDYRDAFKALCDQMIFRNDVPWGEETRDLFVWSLQVDDERVTEAEIEATKALQQAQEQAAQPGNNPRKTVYYETNKDRANVRDAIKRGLRSGPLELQPQMPSDIPQGNWLPAASLGGGMAQVALFVDVDDLGYIRNRIVRKDTHIRRQDWSDMTRWYGNMNSSDLSERYPMEFYCQKIMADISATHVVVPLKCEVDAQSSVFRIYLPYCPYGDLSKLIVHYQMMNELLPEAFIWRVFQVLCETGEMMEKGWLPPKGADLAAHPTWRQIVHRDLKTNNIFLDDSLAYITNINSQWPQVKMADFGLAILTNPDDPLNPRLYNGGAGTRGFLAPEQQPYVDRETRQPVDEFQVLAHTNVWGVGAIIWCLAHLHDLGSHDQPSYLPSDGEHGEQPRFTIEASDEERDNAAHLSPRLRGLIDECLRFEPRLRPSFSQLRSRIDDWIMANCIDDGVGQYLFSAANGVLSGYDISPQHTLWHLEDKDYRIGFALDLERQAHQLRQ